MGDIIRQQKEIHQKIKSPVKFEKPIKKDFRISTDKDVPASNKDYRIRLNDSFDDKASKSKIRMKSKQDGWILEGGYDLNALKESVGYHVKSLMEYQ